MGVDIILKKDSIKILIPSIYLLFSISSCYSDKSIETTDKPAISSSSQDNIVTTEDTVIRFAVSGDNGNINKAVKKFNEADNGYIVELVYYNQNTDESDSLNITDFDLVQDIINTSDIDIITGYSFIEEANYKNLQQKGAFADLYQFMENDTEINTQTLNSHVLQLNEIDGKLFSIPTFYTANTLIGNPEYVGTEENWTIDELIDYWRQMPDNATINQARTKECTYYTLLRNNLELYIDCEKGIVNFDCEDFRKALAFCNKFEYNNQQKTEYDYEAEDFCSDCSITSFQSIATYDVGNDKPKVTFVGYPSYSNSGAYLRAWGDSFSISVKADENRKKGAWEFIRTFFSEEWQEENVLSYHDRTSDYATQNAFCMNKKALENIKNNTVNKKYSPPTYESKGETFTTYFPTIEDCNALEDYLNSINRWEVHTYEDVSLIVEEEAFAYFAGEISIDECIERIQNRTSIWISEKS